MVANCDPVPVILTAMETHPRHEGVQSNALQALCTLLALGDLVKAVVASSADVTTGHSLLDRLTNAVQFALLRNALCVEAEAAGGAVLSALSDGVRSHQIQTRDAKIEAAAQARRTQPTLRAVVANL